MKSEPTPTARLREQSITHLALTLQTTRALAEQGIDSIGILLDRIAAGPSNLGLDAKRQTEIRDVLASRGL